MTLTIIGLCLNIVGALFLSYEFICGFQKRVWARYARDKLEVLERDMESRKAYIDKIPSPPYSVEDLEEMKLDIDHTWMPLIEGQYRIISESEIKHPNRAILVAMLGVFLMISGFIVQIIDAVDQRAENIEHICESSE